MIRALCVPCAEKLKDTYTVTSCGGPHVKITCAICGRRRYGTDYKVEKKER